MAEDFSLSIKSLTKRGWGASDDYEVFGALPGEQIIAQKIKRGKARLLSIETKSPDRVDARCSHAGSCGGCAFQTLDYSAQLLLKQNRIQSLFTHPVNPIIPCDEPFQMRNKMEFSFSQDKAGNKFLGLHMPAAKGRVIDIEHCHLVAPWFSDALQAVRTWWSSNNLNAFHPHRQTGALRTLTMREGKRTGSRMVILTVDGAAREELTQNHLSAFKALFDQDTSLFLHIHQAIAGKPTELFEMHLQGPDHLSEELHLEDRILKFSISPAAFFQPNTYQAEKLYTAALKLCLPLHGSVYDLYAGVASLGILFAPYASDVTSVEINPYSICDAETNIELNGITNLKLIRSDVALALADLPKKPALALIDPPRAGLGPKAIAHLKELNPDQILYISCNPNTQAQDIEQLSAYEIKTLQPVDQFPHTPHLENIALLVKKL
ncbi:MAG: 23S rRNA (uracil(1939)-C(5))-methyltransferase RlmD [Chlamydiales bacterium]|nr:23S rRNA (uracil(1939)-C(5))-methyltransferase RlmD [Chlamydiales bacterium]